MITPSDRPTAILDFLHDTSASDIPDDVLAFGQRCLLDLLGVAAAGSATELSRIGTEHAISHFGAGTKAAPILFDGRMVSPAGAALGGGMTIDAIDAHDGHKITKGHTGCHQLPALLAFSAAEKLDDPLKFLVSLVVGYEFATRAGIALHASVSDYHTSGAWGAVGVAGLGSRVLGLSHGASFEALGIAEYHGPRSQMMRVIDHPTMLKDGSGWGAMAGVSATYLAADGFTGAPAVTVCAPELAEIYSDLGSRWLILEQYFKPHPVCRWAQPAVEAALSLCRDHLIAGGDVAAIEVATFHEAARLATSAPTTTEQAQYSLPFPVAAAVARGQLGATEIMGASLTAPDICRLADAVTIVEDRAHNEAFPANRFARVTIELHDGSRYISPDTEPKGDPEHHLTDAEIRAKFHTLASPVLGVERAKAIEDAVGAMTDGRSLSDLVGLLHY